jgi:uncharacterized membrane protein
MNLWICPALASAGYGDGVGAIALFGRLHPSLVHFPIVLILLALVAELAALRWKKAELRWAGPVLLVCGAIAAIPAALAGWALSEELEFAGRMDEIRTLHAWAGASVAITVWPLLALRLWLTRRTGKTGHALYLAALCVLAAGVALTGHLGGSLVYGPDFLPGWP